MINQTPKKDTIVIGLGNILLSDEGIGIHLIRRLSERQDKFPSVEFIDTPVDIRDKYQYFTEAKMDKLRSAGYTRPFYTLESAITEYVQGYLAERVCF